MIFGLHFKIFDQLCLFAINPFEKANANIYQYFLDYSQAFFWFRVAKLELQLYI